MRLFAAVELLPELRQALRKLVGRLAMSQADVKWVEGENFHLTLLFLGEVDRELLPELSRALAEAARGVPAFHLRLEGLGTFPGPGRPRVIWVGADGGGELGRLQSRVVEQAGPFAERPPERTPFHPHITLGRVRSPRGLAGLKALLEEYREEKVGVQEVSGFSLVESRLYRSGPVYTTVDHFWLERA
ncbi:MAG: RNA 2',3'-cyclic phosphodiesterase [Clostridia bacterium]|jgi:2'-5' RNA ligase|nr:RNA 2',3'-cyclic phosphodiesterase [Clostridia bacterium]MDH7572935.1 RNA 2',3'-cyclic phosphodiesterase [Clostridia bacterium]